MPLYFSHVKLQQYSNPYLAPASFIGLNLPTLVLISAQREQDFPACAQHLGQLLRRLPTRRPFPCQNVSLAHKIVKRKSVKPQVRPNLDVLYFTHRLHTHEHDRTFKSG